MSEKRMAGDKINEDRNFAARQAIANDPEKSAAKLSRVSGDYDLSGYSDKDVIMAFQGDSFGADDYQRLTGKSADGPPVNPPGGGIEPEVDGDPVVPEVAPITAGPINIDTGSGDVNTPAMSMPYVPNPGNGYGNTSQTVVQDNDQISSVVGNDNTVNQDQDNSVAQYGSGGKFKDMWMNEYFSA